MTCFRWKIEFKVKGANGVFVFVWLNIVNKYVNVTPFTADRMMPSNFHELF